MALSINEMGESHDQAPRLVRLRQFMFWLLWR